MLSNQRITTIQEIISPAELLAKYKPTEDDETFILESRRNVEDILIGKDSRMMVILGPCSIHDVDAAIEYAQFLQTIQPQLPNLYLVMRVYFEKPRSRLGWKGLIYDPDLDESFHINKGLDIARKLLLTLTQMRIPIGCEFLDTLTPQYLSDLISWGAIGARTSESQIHRQLASGLSMPIGFKNLTSGDYEKAIDGILSAAYPHHFLGIDVHGKVSHVHTTGNTYGHIILRGGDQPNYDETTLSRVSASLTKEKIRTGIVVDCSHGNSQKDHNRQILVALHVLRQRHTHRSAIRGIMLESNLQKGKQALANSSLKRGVSITDACIDIPTTRHLLHILNAPTVITCTTLDQTRHMIRQCDVHIHSNYITTFPAPICLSKYILEEDKDVAELCSQTPDQEISMMMIVMRLGLSERIAELKLTESPFEYMRRQNDFLPLITRRSVESEILQSFQDPIFLKIMELSKRIQVRCLERLTHDIRIGYLFGPGTFSHEVALQFRGNLQPYPSVESLRNALRTHDIEYILLPSYNSIIGKIYSPSEDMLVCGTLEHPIELSLYANVPMSSIQSQTQTQTILADNLYVEPHILRECESYIQKRIRANTVLVASSVEGCRACIRDTEKGIVSLTISSIRNQSNFLTTVQSDLVPHNVTTFSFVARADIPPVPLPRSMELLCHV